MAFVLKVNIENPLFISCEKIFDPVEDSDYT